MGTRVSQEGILARRRAEGREFVERRIQGLAFVISAEGQGIFGK